MKHQVMENHGERILESLALKIPISDLSSHVLDEIIDNILNNPENFECEGPDGLDFCLCINTKGLKDRFNLGYFQDCRR